MTASRRRALATIALILVAGLAAAIAVSRNGDQGDLAARAPAERPTLLLLTSLPLVFGEDFSLDQAGSPVLEALERRYRVVPIATTAPDQIEGSDLMVMAHPLAQPAENLVALDRWVRAGGRVLLLADPMLEWPDSRPLGDPTRPPPMFMDTGLLAHWGLTLEAPVERSEREVRIGGHGVRVRSPGTLRGDCAISDEGLVARCTIGKGAVTVIADADFLDWTGAGGKQGAAALVDILGRLESGKSV